MKLEDYTEDQDLYLSNPKGRIVVATKALAARTVAVQRTFRKGVLVKENLGYGWTLATEADIRTWKEKYLPKPKPAAKPEK